MRRMRFLACVALAAFATGATADETFVCGQHVIESGTGMTKFEVVQKCGEPTEKGPDRWYYANQPGGRTVVLVWQIGTLEQIQTLSNE